MTFEKKDVMLKSNTQGNNIKSKDQKEIQTFNNNKSDYKLVFILILNLIKSLSKK